MEQNSIMPMQYFPSQTYQRRALSCCHPTCPFLFGLPQKPPTFPAAHAFGKVTYAVSASSSLWVAINPSAGTAHAACPSTHSQEPSSILPDTRHLATGFLACLATYENYNHRVSSASLNLPQDLCPSSPLHYPREHACKEGTWLYTKAEKTSGKPPAKQSIQRTAFSQQNL